MFSIKELEYMRKLIDDNVRMANEDAMKIRQKICDLILVHKAWNKDMSIEELFIED